MLLPVGEPLVAARELLELLLDLELLRKDALLDLQHLGAPVGELRVDLAAQADGLLSGVDLGLPAHGVTFALGVLEELVPDAAGLRDARRAEHRDCEQGEGDSSGDPDGNSDPDHCLLLGRRSSRLLAARSTRRRAYPAAIREAFSGRAAARRESIALPRARPPSRRT